MTVCRATTSSSPWMKAFRMLVAIPAVWTIASLTIVACGSSDHDCSRSEGFDEESGTCLCLSGLVRQNGECKPCGAHEILTTNACVCEPGYERAAEGDPCTLASDANPMAGAPCASNDDCGVGTYCELSLSPATCQLEPTGQGQPCTTDADCAGFDANFCEAGVSHTCLVRGCSPTLNNCTADRHCCDFASFGLPSLCIVKEFQGTATACP